MDLKEIIQLPEVGYRIADENLNQVKEGENLDRIKYPCCDNPKMLNLKAPAWEIAEYCQNCNGLIISFPQDGKSSGGTGQAMRIAEDYFIPIFNLHGGGDFEKWYKHNNFDIL